MQNMQHICEFTHMGIISAYAILKMPYAKNMWYVGFCKICDPITYAITCSRIPASLCYGFASDWKIVWASYLLWPPSEKVPLRLWCCRTVGTKL